MSHTIVVQENMKSAQDYLNVHRDNISLILLDLGLPDTIDAEDSYHQLCSCNPSGIPVIALTSIENQNMSYSLSKLGLEDFLCKNDVMYAPLLLSQAINFVLSPDAVKGRSIRHMAIEMDSCIH